LPNFPANFLLLASQTDNTYPITFSNPVYPSDTIFNETSSSSGTYSKFLWIAPFEKLHLQFLERFMEFFLDL
jgi:hypothetical protein